MRPVILAHYHEIGLKGKNKPLFLRYLMDNIRRAVTPLDAETEFIGDRAAIYPDTNANKEAIRARLQKIPGIANVMPGYLIHGSVGDLAKAVSAVLQNEARVFSTFRVETQRADKAFPQTSEDINRGLGHAVQDATGAKVNLTIPDLTIWVRVLGKSRGIFFGFDKFDVTGGLPVGTGGKVAALLSGGIDSPVAAWMMMRRGCRVLFVHFHSFPYLDKSTQEKCRELISALDPYQMDSILYLVPFGDIQAKIVASAPAAYRVLLYRRAMLSIIERIAIKEGAQAIVTGENLGQVASQTLENIAAIEEAATLPILRPLIGMDKRDIIERARAIGTYEISIRPDQDCCQLFTPRNPATKTTATILRAAEQPLGLEELLKSAAEKAEIFTPDAP